MGYDHAVLAIVGGLRVALFLATLFCIWNFIPFVWQLAVRLFKRRKVPLSVQLATGIVLTAFGSLVLNAPIIFGLLPGSYLSLRSSKNDIFVLGGGLVLMMSGYLLHSYAKTAAGNRAAVGLFGGAIILVIGLLVSSYSFIHS
jgi:hypothetical protein